MQILKKPHLRITDLRNPDLRFTVSEMVMVRIAQDANLVVFSSL